MQLPSSVPVFGRRTGLLFPGLTPFFRAFLLNLKNTPWLTQYSPYSVKSLRIVLSLYKPSFAIQARLADNCARWRMPEDAGDSGADDDVGEEDCTLSLAAGGRRRSWARVPIHHFLRHLLELDDAALAIEGVEAADNTRAVEQVEEVEVERRECADVRQGGETAESSRGMQVLLEVYNSTLRL